MPTSERQDVTISTPDGNVQHQSVRRNIAPIAQEEPSTIKYLVQSNDYLKSLSKQLAGWVQLPDDDGNRLIWRQLGRPLMNEKGRGWLITQLSSILDKYIRLSNLPEGRIPIILRTEFKGLSLHLATHMTDYELEVVDCENVMLYARRAIEASYRSSVGDKERKHIYGSLDEATNMVPQKQGGIWSMFPKPF